MGFTGGRLTRESHDNDYADCDQKPVILVYCGGVIEAYRFPYMETRMPLVFYAEKTIKNKYEKKRQT